MSGQVQLSRRFGLASLLLVACTPNPSGFGIDDSSTSTSTSTGSATTSGSTGSSGGVTSVGSSTGGTGGESTTGVSVDSTGDDTTTTGGPQTLPCDRAERGLMACYDFAGIDGGTLEDRTSQDNDGAVTDVDVVPGPFGEAAMFGPDARIEIPDSESLDISEALTFGAWIRPDALPELGRMGILDNDGQYSMFIYASDEYRCAAAGADFRAGPVVLREWTHVACVHDDVRGEVRLYVNGMELDSQATMGDVNTNNPEPISIGDDSPSFAETFIGAIGGVRVWSAVRSPAQLCEAAGDLCDA